MLQAFGHPFVTCWMLLSEVCIWSNLNQQHPPCHNTLQHVQRFEPNNVATCCIKMLRLFGQGLHV